MANLEDLSCDDSEVIGRHVLAVYGIQPYVLPTGDLGVHFMEMSYSAGAEDCTDKFRRELTLADYIRNIVADYHAKNTTHDEACEELQKWRDTLAAALQLTDDSLAILRTTTSGAAKVVG